MTGNAAPNGGAIENLGPMGVYNSIITGNTQSSGSDIFSYTSISFTGVNLTTGLPLLAPLGSYGGRTPTMPPLPGSSALNGCTSGTSFATDQRGNPRILGAYADIGAVEGVYNPAGPGRLTGMNRAANGVASFTFTNYTYMSFTVLATTNVALPLNQWSNLGPAVEAPVGSGHYQFTDPSAANTQERFYRVSSP